MKTWKLTAAIALAFGLTGAVALPGESDVVFGPGTTVWADDYSPEVEAVESVAETPVWEWAEELESIKAWSPDRHWMLADGTFDILTPAEKTAFVDQMFDDYHHEVTGRVRSDRKTEGRHQVNALRASIREQLADDPERLRRFDDDEVALVHFRLRTLNSFLRMREEVPGGNMEVVTELIGLAAPVELRQLQQIMLALKRGGAKVTPHWGDIPGTCGFFQYLVEECMEEADNDFDEAKQEIVDSYTEHINRLQDKRSACYRDAEDNEARRDCENSYRREREVLDSVVAQNLLNEWIVYAARIAACWLIMALCPGDSPYM